MQVAQRKWQTLTLTLTLILTLTLNLLTLSHLRCAICIAPFALRRIQIAGLALILSPQVTLILSLESGLRIRVRISVRVSDNGQ